MGRNYGVKQFKNELKVAMHSAGVEDEQVFLLMEDHNFGDPAYLDMINSLLSSGEVPGLYTPEELEPLLTPLRDKGGNSIDFKNRSNRLPKVGCSQKYPFGAHFGCTKTQL